MKENALESFKSRAIATIAPRTEFRPAELHAIATAMNMGFRLMERTMRTGTIYVHPDVDNIGLLYYQIIISSDKVIEGKAMEEGTRSVLVIPDKGGPDILAMEACVVNKGVLKTIFTSQAPIHGMHQGAIELMVNHLLIGDELINSSPVWH